MAVRQVKNILGKFFRTLAVAQAYTKQVSEYVETSQDRTDLLTPAILEKIGEIIRDKIIERTLRGEDFRGRQFIDYSPQYAKRKKKLTGSDKVNLKLSGGMLDDFYVRVDVNPEYADKDIYFIDYGYFTIHYGFHSEEATEKYYWNADNQYGKHRDFIGAAQGVPLIKNNELLEIIQIAIRERWK
jgi:RNA-binding protein YlmH